MSLLEERGLLLGKIESTEGTDAAPDATNDAFRVGSPEWSMDVARLSRNNLRNSLSREPTTAGRITAAMSFTHEVRGSGAAGTAPKVGRLLRACGMAQTQVVSAGAAVIRAHPGNTGGITFVGSGAYTGTEPRLFVIECTKAGGTGVAQATVKAVATPTQAAVSVSAATLTNAAAFTLAQGLTVTPTFGVSLAVGDKFYVLATPAGWLYTPVSDQASMESITLHMYRDKQRHTMTGARGNVTLTAEAGGYGILNFTFQGRYVRPSEQTLPASPVLSTLKPAKVESAQVSIDGVMANCPQQFGFDLGVATAYRECANAEQGIDGVRITDRLATASFNPEAQTENSHAVAQRIEDGTELSFFAAIGKTTGNRFAMLAHGQYATAPYGSREKILTHEIGLELAGVAGNDELILFFG